MRVSCICVCHNKPDVTHEAIGSIVGQTFPDWEAIVVDSGVLYDAGYYDRFGWRADGRIRLLRSHETEQTRRTRAMAPWCFNECFRRGLVRGDLVTYLCDDDVLYPDAFATFVAYCRHNPDAQAMYASQDVGVIYPNGWHAIVGERRATRPGGRCCNGRRMDGEVDYLQFCHRADVLKRFPDDEYWPEAKETEEHADGLFMERVGKYVPIHPIDVKVSQNRRTARSTYTPLPSLGLVDCMANGVPLLPGRLSSIPGVSPQVLPLANGGRPSGATVTVSVVGPNPGAALDSLAAQTYPPLEILVAEDRAGHNRALADARGTYFIPMPADHVACPDMVERLVARMCANPRLAAATCYMLELGPGAYGPPQAGVRNVYGHAIFRTEDFRAVGGYDAEGDESGRDWSAFFKLVNAGRQVDILPEHLFYSHTTAAGGEMPGLMPFLALDRALAAERAELWKALADQGRRLEEVARENQELRARLGLLRYRVADRLDALCARVPFVRRALKRLLSGS
jgi:glycosyltransferase involved in cell wall biosynthesis